MSYWDAPHLHCTNFRTQPDIAPQCHSSEQEEGSCIQVDGNCSITIPHQHQYVRNITCLEKIVACFLCMRFLCDPKTRAICYSMITASQIALTIKEKNVLQKKYNRYAIDHRESKSHCYLECLYENNESVSTHSIREIHPRLLMLLIHDHPFRSTLTKEEIYSEQIEAALQTVAFPSEELDDEEEDDVFDAETSSTTVQLEIPFFANDVQAAQRQKQTLPISIPLSQACSRIYAKCADLREKCQKRVMAQLSKDVSRASIDNKQANQRHDSSTHASCMPENTECTDEAHNIIAPILQKMPAKSAQLLFCTHLAQTGFITSIRLLNALQDTMRNARMPNDPQTPVTFLAGNNIPNSTQNEKPPSIHPQRKETEWSQMKKKESLIRMKLPDASDQDICAQAISHVFLTAASTSDVPIYMKMSNNFHQRKQSSPEDEAIFDCGSTINLKFNDSFIKYVEQDH